MLFFETVFGPQQLIVQLQTELEEAKKVAKKNFVLGKGARFSERWFVQSFQNSFFLASGLSLLYIFLLLLLCLSHQVMLKF